MFWGRKLLLGELTCYKAVDGLIAFLNFAEASKNRRYAVCFIGGVNLWCDRKKPMSPLKVNKTTGWEESVFMTERADQRICINVPAHSTAHMQAFFFFWQNIASPRSVSTRTAQIWLPATSGFFPKLNSPLTLRIFMNATVTQYMSSVNGISLPTD